MSSSLVQCREFAFHDLITGLFLLCSSFALLDQIRLSATASGQAIKKPVTWTGRVMG
jgi:hypothetical protein